MVNTDWTTADIYNPKTDEQIQGEIDAYDGGIYYTDQQIDLLLKELDGRGVLDNTIVVITSDHGEMFGEHGLWEHHNSLYKPVIHVPLIVWYPQSVPQAMRIFHTSLEHLCPCHAVGYVRRTRADDLPLTFPSSIVD